MKSIVFFKIASICCMLLLLPLEKTYSQNTWSLQKCIDHALKNNIRIKQTELNVEISNDKVIQNKANFVPSLNGGVNNFYNFGRTIDQFTNQFVSERTLNLNFSISSSVTLFNGFQLINSLKQSQLEYLAEKSELEKIKNDISLNITAAFLQILFNMEVVDVSKLQLENSKEQKQRIQKLYENGAVAKGNLLDIEAQLSSEEMRLVNAENQLSISKLSLAQLLDVNSVDDFSIEKPQVQISDMDNIPITAEEVYETSLKNQPAVKTAYYRTSVAEKALKVANGMRSPKFVLSGSYGTGYSDQRQRLAGIKETTELIGYTSTQLPVFTRSGIPIFEKTPFANQMDDNINQSVGIICNIPLFNSWSTKTAVSRAKLSLLSTQFNEQLVKNELRKNVYQAYLDVKGGKKKYEANLKNLRAIEESYNYMEQRFNAGAVNLTDFVNLKTNLSKAQSDLIQAKYDYIFKIKILDFYQGKNLTF